MLCWIFPRCRKAHAWRPHSGLAMASHCTGFRSAARTSVPARRGGARSSMRTFRPAAPGSTSQTQPARNPCRAHNDVRGDRPVRQPRRRPGQHEAGQHIGLQRRQILRRHRRPPPADLVRLPGSNPGLLAFTQPANERSRRYAFRNPEFTSDGRTRIDRARRPRYWVYRGTGGLRELWGYFLIRRNRPAISNGNGRLNHDEAPVVCEDPSSYRSFVMPCRPTRRTATRLRHPVTSQPSARQPPLTILKRPWDRGDAGMHSD